MTVGFDRNDRDFIRQQSKDLVRDTRIGRVVQVYEHSQKSDYSNFEVDAVFDGGEFEERVAPVANPYFGTIAVPRVGDKVLIDYIESDREFPVIRNVIYTNRDRALKGAAGMFRSEVVSDESPAGKGNFYITEYTEYEGDPSMPQWNKDNATVQKSRIQVQKKQDEMDTESDLDSTVHAGFPINIEVVEDIPNEQSKVIVEMNPAALEETNQTDFQPGSMRFVLDANERTMKAGILPSGDETDANLDDTLLQEGGLKFWMREGSFKLLDGQGYGFSVDGMGKMEKYQKEETVISGEVTDFTTSPYEDMNT